MSYWETYKARLNRNGANHADRLNVGREVNFEKFLRQSPHYVKFEHNGKEVEAVFDPSSQKENKTVMHTYWTQKGRLFLYDLLKNSENILPTIEKEMEG